MPSTTEKQRRYMGYELSKQRETGTNDTEMSEQQLRDFAKKPKSERKTTRKPKKR